MTFQFYVYNAAKRADGSSDVVFQTQVFSDGKLAAASAVQPAGLQMKDGAPVPETRMMPLATLAPGEHELRVLIEDRVAGASTMRRVPFTVE